MCEEITIKGKVYLVIGTEKIGGKYFHWLKNKITKECGTIEVKKFNKIKYELERGNLS